MKGKVFQLGLMKNGSVAFYPCHGKRDSYIHMMREMIARHFDVIDYISLKKQKHRLLGVKYIYLNWIENRLDDDDRKLLKMASMIGIRVIWVFHNKMPHDAHDDMEEKRENMRFLTRMADKIIIHSHQSRPFLLDYDPRLDMKKVYFLPHIGYMGQYMAYCPDIRQMLGIGDDEFLFSSLGSLQPYKNIGLLIEAMEDLRGMKCKVLIAGGTAQADYYGRLEAAAAKAENVILMNHYIGSLQMAAFLQASDVLVLPYDLKSSMNSGVMIMSFSYGRTVVTSDMAMARDFDEKLLYKYACLSNGEHRAALAESLLCAYGEGREKNHQKGEVLRRVVMEQNSETAVEKRMREILK